MKAVMVAAVLLFVVAGCGAAGVDVAQSTSAATGTDPGQTSGSGTTVTPPVTTPPPVTSPPPAAAKLSISGQPAVQATIGSSYSFTPTTNSSAVLTFTVSDAPAWASFNTKTGELSGSPASGSIGTYSGIAIAVTDGTSSAALPAFSINVVPPAVSNATASVTLGWNVPTSNSDGSPLTDLAGYRLYYGKTAAALDQSVQVGGSSSTSYTVQGLTSGLWYFAIQSVSTVGVESELSAVASATVL